MTTTAAPRRTTRAGYRVDELQRAVHALDAGRFRGHARRASADSCWEPAEPVVAVLGCLGSAGATTVAVAMATAALGPARVVEYASASASGLIAASTAELGPGGPGWQQGQRGEVLLERLAEPIDAIDLVPVPVTPRRPGVTPPTLTVLDVAWPSAQAFHAESWVSTHLRTADVVVLVTTATVPGLRRLEVTLEDLAAETSALPVLAVRGPRRKRWARAVEHTLGPRAGSFADDGRFVEIPDDKNLAVHGLTPAPLPTQLLRAATELLRLAAPDAVPLDRKATTR